MRIVIACCLFALLAACSAGETPEKVAHQNFDLRNSPVILGQPNDQHKTSVSKICYWNDKKYSDGATVCDSGQRLKCWGDRWIDIGNC